MNTSTLAPESKSASDKLTDKARDALAALGREAVRVGKLDLAARISHAMDELSPGAGEALRSKPPAPATQPTVYRRTRRAVSRLLRRIVPAAAKTAPASSKASRTSKGRPASEGLVLSRNDRHTLAGLGQKAARKGQLDLALMLAGILRDLAPDRPQAMEIEALAAVTKGDTAFAEQHFLDGLKTFGSSGIAMDWLMRQANGRGDWGTTADLSTSYPLEPRSFHLAVEAADKLAGSGQVARALAVLETVVAAGCTEVDVMIRASTMCLLLGELERNAAILSKLREVYPHNPYGYLGTFHRLTREHKLQAAAEELERLNERFPDHQLIVSKLCENAIERRDSEAAQRYLSALRGRLAGRRLAELQARVYGVTENWDALIDQFKAADFSKLGHRQKIPLIFAHLYRNDIDHAEELIAQASAGVDPSHRNWYIGPRQVAHLRRKRGSEPGAAEYNFDFRGQVSDIEVPPIVRTLWVGGQLTPVERLCLTSWVANGFDLELYTYGEVTGVPEGCTVRDAREILPESAVFAHSSKAGRSQGSYAGFADIFRWRLLEVKGGFWTDCDIVCLRPFELPKTLAIASEIAQTFDVSHPAATNCFYGGPPGHLLFREGTRRATALDPESLKWGEVGTELLGSLVLDNDLEDFVLPHTAFNPVGASRPLEYLFGQEDGKIETLRQTSFGLHLYNEVWRSHRVSKQGPFPRGSVMHHLFAEYGVKVPVEPAIDLRSPSAILAQPSLATGSEEPKEASSGRRKVVLHESPQLQAYLVEPADVRHEELVITFHGRREGGGPPLPGFGETFLEREGFCAVHFLTPHNNWYLFDGASDAISAVAEKLGRFGKRVVYGNSMGGYAALLYAKALGARSCVVAGPQFSINPEVVPFENRWRWTGEGNYDPSLDRLRENADPATKVTLMLDLQHQLDLRHAQLIGSVFPDITCLNVPGGGHDLMRVLRDAGLLQTVVRSALTGEPFPETNGQAVLCQLPRPDQPAVSEPAGDAG